MGIVLVSSMEEIHEEGASRAAAPAAAAGPATAPGPAPAAQAKRRAAPSTSFEGCRPALSQEILEVVKDMGFESMTPVQVRFQVVVCVCSLAYRVSATGNLASMNIPPHLHSLACGGAGLSWVGWREEIRALVREGGWVGVKCG